MTKSKQKPKRKTRPSPSQAASLEFTGERYLPEVSGQIAFEHLHRYQFAAQLAKGKRVLDVACGEGYGSALLASVASRVTGVDIAPDVVAHARAKYRREGLEFIAGSAAALPFEDGSFDVVVSFETIEHHDLHREMVSEIKRVLRPDGLLVISSPNKQYYSIEPGYNNPFHVKELFREELLGLLGNYFERVSVYGQRVVHGSLIVPDDGGAFESAVQDGKDLTRRQGLLSPLYDIVVATDAELPARTGSLFEIKVHGMDPASFYGVHLQERLNAADQEVLVSAAQVQKQERDMSALRNELEDRVSSLAQVLAEKELGLAEWRTHAEGLSTLRGELEDRTRALASEVELLRVELSTRDGRMDALQQALAEKELGLTEWRTHAEALSTLRGELEDRTRALASEVELLRVELSARDGRMDALQQVLAEKEQRLIAAAIHAQHLENWLVELRAHAESLTGIRGELEQRKATLESETRVLRSEIQARDGRLEIMQNLVDEQRAHLADRAAEIHALHDAKDLSARQLHDLEVKFADARQTAEAANIRLQDVASQLQLRHAELTRLLTSNSWKISAPLRWVRNRVDAIRHRRVPAHYRQMLGAPAAVAVPQAIKAGTLSEGESVDAPGVVSAPVTTQKAYLDTIFASEQQGRAPEYVGASDMPPPDTDSLRAKLIAFYLPQFHPFPENDAWWGRGFTEWTNVTKAHPQFLGHHQPHLPGELGFYDLRLPDVFRHQVELARQYGIHGFCFHYYWFAGKRLLERPLDLFLKNTDIDFPFCLCWANENWTRRWDGMDGDILIAQEHTADNDFAFIRDLIEYLRDPRYIKVDGKPLIIVYRPSILPDCAATLVRWRNHCRDVGIGEIFLAMVQFDVDNPRVYGFDAAIEFPPHKLAAGLEAINGSLDIVNPEYQGHVLHYQTIVSSAKAWPEPEYPLVRGVFPGWDNEARRPGRGYTFAFSTPDRYKDWLDSAISYAEAHPVAGEKLVMINAWNEWAEGAHLEPDRRYGRAFLQATREVVEATSPKQAQLARRPRVVVVSHDAHPHGAQYLALQIARELDEVFDYEVELVLLGDGSLTAEFARYANIHQLRDTDGEAAADRLALHLRALGASASIVSTTVSGLFAGALKRAGLKVVSLVHELPGLIADYGLESHAQCIAEHADRVVFAVPEVRAGFAQVASVPPGHAVIRPQGLFSRSRYLGRTDLSEPRRKLRQKLQIPPECQVVLAVGYGDYRKGLDIFGEMAAILADRHQQLHFVWVGHHDDAMMDEVRRGMSVVGAVDRLHAVGLDFDTDDYYAGADIYALTSREDPFPSVVLEALAVGLPVVAFAATGGAEQIIGRGCGRLVDILSAQAIAEAVQALLLDPAARAECAENGRRIIAHEFGFRRYVHDLLAFADIAPPRVSVVVPNYNYAALLRGRLASIAGQDLPAYEVIVLDDHSSDGSLAMLADLRGELPLDFSVVPAARNSGSVFRQWLKGVELTRGDYVWIAEADDLSDPQFLSTVVAALQADPDVSMSYCQSRAIGGDGQLLTNDYLAYTDDLDTHRWTRPYVASGEQEVNAGLAIKNTIPNVSAVVFRRDALLATLRDGIATISNYRVAGDWVTYLMLLEHGRIAYSPEALNLHRRHEGSVTTGANQLGHLQEVVRAQKFARDHYPVSAAGTETASRYAQTLYEQFDLVAEGAPSVRMHAELSDLFEHPAPSGGNTLEQDACI